MAILTLQRRLREAGRIRIGQQVKAANGKTRPAKLDRFRLTSPDRHAMDAAATLYGGDVHPWDGAPVGQVWELFTDADILPVVIPPATTAFSQFYEAWSGGGCIRRCDGERELLTDSPCLCAGEDEPICKPTTRLSVILQELPGLGVWRLESHGYYAATELAGTVDLCIAAATRGQLLPAVLRLEQRQVKRVGEAVRKFAVPVLDIGVTPNALGLVVGTSPPAPQPALEAGPGDAWQPIAEPAALPVGEIGAAIRGATGNGAATKPRRNSPPPLPPTGLNPRGTPPPDDTEPDAEPDQPLKPTRAQTAKAMALFGELGLGGDEHRDDRLTATSTYVGRTVGSWNDLTRDEASTVIDHLQATVDDQPTTQPALEETQP